MCLRLLQSALDLAFSTAEEASPFISQRDETLKVFQPTREFWGL
jgi:hypothetical protein